jgi:membrane protein YqaA with SNARE-associated domain
MVEAIPGLADGPAGPLWLVAGTYLYCVASGFVFFINAEIFLLAVAAASPPAAAVPLVVAAVLGQMTAKSGMYLAGRGVLSLPFGRKQRRLEAAGRRLQASRIGPGGFTFLSASVGLPPFYVVSILAGTLRIPFLVFFLPGTAGRLIRFGILAFSPQAAMQILE